MDYKKIKNFFSLKTLGMILAITFLIVFQYVWSNFKTISENEQVERLLWAREYERYEQLIALLDGVQISLNDSFKSSDLEFEKKRYERYQIEYLEYLNKFFNELKIIYFSEAYFSESVERIKSFNESYFTASNNQLYFIQKNRTFNAFQEYSKATSLHQSLRDNILDLKNQSEIQHNNQLAEYVKIKDEKINILSMLTFTLFFICLFIYFIFSKLLKQISFQAKELRMQMKELEVLKFAVDSFLLISKTDLNGNITYVNSLFEEISGYKSNELLGKNHRLIKSTEHSEDFFKELWSKIKAGNVWRGHVRNKTKNGEFYWVDSCVLPIINTDGVLEGFISIRSDITKQKELESSLVEKNIFYQSLVSNMSEGLVTQDTEGRIVLCNERASEILERPMDLLLSKNSTAPDWQSIRVDGTEYPAHEHPSMIVLKGEVSHAHGLMGLKFKNRVKWIEINSTPIYGSEKKIIYSLTTFFDVTLKTNQMTQNLAIIQLKEAFLRYQHSLKDFYSFMSFSLHNVFKADFVFVVKLEDLDKHYRLSFKNSLFEFFESDNYVNYEISSHTNVELTQYFFDSFATKPDQRELKIVKYREVKESLPFMSDFDRKIEQCSFIVFSKNDQAHTMIFIGYNEANVEYDQSINRLNYLGALEQMISSALDEEFIREEKEKLQFTLESSGVYFININFHSKKVKIDDSFKKKFDVRENEIGLDEFVNLFRVRDAGKSELDELLADLFSRYESFERRVYLKNNIGKRDVYVIKGKISKDKEKYSYYCTLIDETRNEMLEEEIERQKDIVYQNQKLAAIGELAAGVGHEINNPLTIISGYVQKLRRFHFSDLSQETSDEYFKNMEKSIHRIKNIVTGLRKFSHKNSIDVEIVDLYVCIADVVEMVRDIYFVDGITVRFDIKASEFLIVGNYGKIQQVVINLMNNARDALKEINQSDKTIEIKLSLNSSKIIVEILDNGPGIPEDSLGKIFNAFYTTKQVGDGTGLGLSIVHNIMKEHNAEIEVSSKVNEFTKFTMTFERHQKDDNVSKGAILYDESTPEIKIDGNAEVFELLKGKKILIVEDEVSIRDILKDILEDYSVTIVEAENGLIALEQIAKHKFDLVLTDMKMPIMTGQELLERVKEFENIELSRFVIMSGGVNLVLDNLKQEYGFSDIINKPFNDHDLILKIFLALKKLNIQKEVA